MFVRPARIAEFLPLLAGAALLVAGTPQAQAQEYDRWAGPGEAAVNARIAALAQACRDEMGLPLTYDPQEVIASVDFNGDGRIDPVLDQSKVGCDGSAVLWSGTGGAPVRLFVSNADGGWDEHTTGGFAGRVVVMARSCLGATRAWHRLRRSGGAAMCRGADLGRWSLPFGC